MYVAFFTIKWLHFAFTTEFDIHKIYDWTFSIGEEKKTKG